MVIESLYYKMLKWFHNNHPDKIDRFIQSISPNQQQSKEWLMECLDNVVIPRDSNGQFKIEIIGGWFGFPLIDLLYEKFGEDIRGIDFFEMDEFACKVCNVYMSLAGMPYSDVRLFKKDYFSHCMERRTHLVINTSCEHMKTMDTMKEYYIEPARTLLVLQSNDKTDEDDHINCVNSPTELCEQAGIRQLYGDFKTLKSMYYEETTYWNRFIAMGKWYD